MHTTRSEIQQLKILINEKLHQTYLKKYIQKPMLDEDKLLILYTIVNNSPISSDKKERYIITTMLVQIALDTHELVPDKYDLNENSSNTVQGQLYVLAGDYYSGLYYLLLSEIEDFSFIQTLASAIKEINELKMKNYYLEVESVEEFIYNKNYIDTLLIIRVADALNQKELMHLTKEWFLSNTLIHEIERLDDGAASLFENYIRSTNADISSIKDYCNQLLSRQIEKLKTNTLEISNQHNVLKKHIMATLKREFE
ncbi:heptaprenyl diphosphate synthase component 1 [Ornithinibacillus salinisoli]|uniref:Heptaprenyl diphosphate synthase component 1 n=1 Tax=Ornithinibacillus salinisoli TaxID=1848459 RepID=A0ABW4W4A4_9BACI